MLVRTPLLLPLLASLATAQWPGSWGHEPPEVISLVHSMQSEYSQWTGYHGPTQFPHPPYPKPTATSTSAAAGSTNTCAYWMEDIKHQGIAAFNPTPGYQVFRNVKDFGAKGDGVTDDTAAINAAISSGARLGPGPGITGTNTPALVYFPAGTYLLSGSIVDYYYTQLIGNPNCMPVLLANATFSGFGLIDGDQYGANGLGFGATNVFYRQVRNFIFDMTAIPASSAATGIHWPTAQATSLMNCVFKMSDAPGTQHVGVFLESGSGGFMNDLVFYGGLFGMNQGNQQFTMRNLTFHNCKTAINTFWDWGWTYKGLNINNCSVGLDMSSGGTTSVAAVIVMDSIFSNTPLAINTSRTATTTPPESGTLIVENVQLNNVPVAIENPMGVVLAGTTGSTTIAAWAEGHEYNPTGPKNVFGPITPNPRPASLLTGSVFYQRSKPQYANLPASSFLSTRNSGAAGDGTADDTAPVQSALLLAAAQGKVCFFDAGTYRVTRTLYVPPGSRLVGESYSVIMSSGAFFADMAAPQPVVQVGRAGGEVGAAVEWSDMIVSTQGPQAGAVLIQWNLAAGRGAATPSGMWDVHERIGGFIGSNLQGNTCPAPTTNGNLACIGAFLGMHVTPQASGLYLENNWLWTADHDIDANYGGNQITIYTGRGLLIESRAGNIWLYGTAVEHFEKVQYSFYGVGPIVMGQIQTETAYWQPSPNASAIFPANAAYHDPVFPSTPYLNGSGYSIPNADGLGLYAQQSAGPVLVYGAGHYSFFDNYSTTCSNQGNGEVCQSRIVELDASNVYLYDLHTVGANQMLTVDGVDRAAYANNQAGFTGEIAVVRTAGYVGNGGGGGYGGPVGGRGGGGRG